MIGLFELVVLALGIIIIGGPALAARLRRRDFEDDVTDDYEPTVTVVTPLFNEGEQIRQTIRSILAQDYPADKLNVIIVDDCSTDDSYEHAVDETRSFPRVTVLRNDVNMGKRRSITRAVRAASTEIIVSVDSDVIIAPDAVRQLIRRFTSDRIAAVGGRVDIRNKRENWLTRMQAAKYHYGYHFIKSLERTFRTVLCLSGCLTAYRRSVLLELEPVLENRNVLGVPIKYGEDRFLTRQIIKAGYETTMTMDAVCQTLAPSQLGDYFNQQLRWRRSNVVDYFGGMSHVWRIHPLIAIHYYTLFASFLAYPALLFHSLWSGKFMPLMVMHVVVVALFGIVYRIQVRKFPREQRVSAWDFLPMAVIMPVTYAVLTPLALLTLDSGKWETRNHVASEVDTEPVAEPIAIVPATVHYAPRHEPTLTEDVAA